MAIALPGKWLSCGNVVEMYRDQVEGGAEKATALLAKFPFIGVANKLDTRCLLASEEKFPHQDGHTFFVELTIRAIEHFLGRTFAAHDRTRLASDLKRDERYRKELSFFFTNPFHPLWDDKQEFAFHEFAIELVLKKSNRSMSPSLP